MISRGLRNNNPLNIRRNATKWRGLRQTQSDKSFFQFVRREWGYRAGIKILRTYQKRYKLYTLREMLVRFAPPVENNTSAYIKTVSNRAKIRPDVAVDLNDKNIVIRLIEAMSFVENGEAGSLCEIERGFNLV